jgi:hypothetical protein
LKLACELLKFWEMTPLAIIIPVKRQYTSMDSFCRWVMAFALVWTLGKFIQLILEISIYHLGICLSYKLQKFVSMHIRLEK